MTNGSHNDADLQRLAKIEHIISALVGGLAFQFPPELVLQGAVKGAAVVLMRNEGMRPQDVAQRLEELAAEFRELGQMPLRVVTEGPIHET